MDVSVERIFDKEIIMGCIMPLFNDIVEDGTGINALKGYVDVFKDLWVSIHAKNELVGVVQFKPYNRTMLEIHPFIQKPFRKYSEKAGKAALKYASTHAPKMYNSIITNIPASKRYASLFARKIGFKEIGRYKDGFFKDGAHCDMVLFQRGIF